jgi:type II secretory pathway pseudopilin PulG
MRSESGFSLVELLVATTMLLVVLGGFMSAATPAMQVARSAPEGVDAEQRARAGADLLMRDLYAAGAGLDAGPLAGSLMGYFPPVLPRRLVGGLDGPTAARADAISLLWTPATLAQSTLAAPLAGTTTATLAASPGCLVTLPTCHFLPNIHNVIFDDSAHFDLFSVEQATGGDLTLRALGTASGHAYAAAANVSEIQARIYYFDPVSRTLRMSDGDATDVPVLDDVVRFRVDYFGSTSPPARPKPPLGVANCLYDAAGTWLPPAVAADEVADGLAAMPLAAFTDGPWCGSGLAAFDADLLRVRRIRVTLGLQASLETMRGTGALFANPGTSRSVWTSVPDAQIVFDVTPRNLTP